MKTIKIHRKYTGWEYRAISLTTVIDEKLTNIIFGISRLKENDPWDTRVEIYRGPNYIKNSKDSNWSRNYSLSEVPPKYIPYVTHLRDVHKSTLFENNLTYINEN